MVHRKTLGFPPLLASEARYAPTPQGQGGRSPSRVGETPTKELHRLPNVNRGGLPPLTGYRGSLLWHTHDGPLQPRRREIRRDQQPTASSRSLIAKCLPQRAWPRDRFGPQSCSSRVKYPLWSPRQRLGFRSVAGEMRAESSEVDPCQRSCEATISPLNRAFTQRCWLGFEPRTCGLRVRCSARLS